MRIVLKPGGIIVTVGLIASLAVYIVRNNKPHPSSVASAQPSLPTSLSGEVVPLLENGDFSGEFTSSWRFAAGAPPVVKEAVPGGPPQYIHLTVVPGKDSWSVNMGQSIKKPLKKGDNVLFKGWFRSPESLVLHFYIEEATVPHAKAISHQIYLTPQWEEKSVQGVVEQDYAPGATQLMIHFGLVPGSVDMAGFQLQNYGATVPPAESTRPVPVATDAPKALSL